MTWPTGVQSPQFQAIAHRGSCGKTRVLSQNGWPRAAVILRNRGRSAHDQPCRGDRRRGADRDDAGGRAGAGRDRRGDRRASGRVQLVEAAHAGAWELPVLGEVSTPAAVLVRPDGYVAWVGDITDPGLADALTTWFGPPAAA